MPAAIEHFSLASLPALRLRSGRGATAVVSLFGAQVLSWCPSRGGERLYLSPQARLDGQGPIRGGVPVCFPQFADQGPLPMHGFARTAQWQVATQRAGDDYALVSLQLTDSEATRALWPHPFRVELGVLIEDDRLDLELEIENTGAAPFAFTGALHTYLAVPEVEEIRLEGLHGHTYRDKTRAGASQRDSGDALIVEREIDRVYRAVTRPLLLNAARASLGIAQSGFADVVVWNPWVERSAALPDLPDNGFRRFVCVEAAAACEPVSLPAGATWWGRQTLVAL